MTPQHIEALISQIKESEHRWKALYMATWGESYRVKEKYENTPLWEMPLALGLPASKNKYHIFSSAQYFHNILVTRDGEIALNHMTTMLSLLEKLVKEFRRYKYPNEEPLNTGKRNVLVKFLKDYGFLLEEEEMEFRLAGETRNCVVHNGHVMDDRWLQAYSNARNASFLTMITTDLYRAVRLPQVEEWHQLFFRITERIENSFKDESAVNS